jgi:hypothetical protein
MNVKKAMHRAAAKSLDGRCRFVASIGRTIVVLTLSDLARCPQARVEVAFSFGKLVEPRR